MPVDVRYLFLFLAGIFLVLLFGGSTFVSLYLLVALIAWVMSNRRVARAVRLLAYVLMAIALTVMILGIIEPL